MELYLFLFFLSVMGEVPHIVYFECVCVCVFGSQQIAKSHKIWSVLKLNESNCQISQNHEKLTVFQPFGHGHDGQSGCCAEHMKSQHIQQRKGYLQHLITGLFHNI